MLGRPDSVSAPRFFAAICKCGTRPDPGVLVDPMVEFVVLVTSERRHGVARGGVVWRGLGLVRAHRFVVAVELHLRMRVHTCNV